MSFVILFIISRDLSAEELDLISLYGTILTYNDCYNNLPLEHIIKEYNASYVIFDVRKKSHRIAVQKIDYSINHYHNVAVVHFWEKTDDFIDDAKCENCLSSFPPKQAFKKDFDKLLIEKKIRQPSCFKSLIRVICSILSI